LITAGIVLLAMYIVSAIAFYRWGYKDCEYDHQHAYENVIKNLLSHPESFKKANK